MPIDKIAWIHVEDRRVLCARSRDSDVFYLPGGKREPGESDLECLVREVREELAVELLPDTARHLACFQTQAHGRPAGQEVRMECYTAEHVGTPRIASEIAEIALLCSADLDRVSAMARLVFARLRDDDLID